MDWAYIAGCIECDGSIGLAKHTCKTNSGYRPFINFTNTSKALIDALNIELGGCLITPTGKSWRRVVWDDFDSIEYILINILPYLIYKKEQAGLLLAFVLIRRNLPNTTNEKGRFVSHHSPLEKEICERLKELHKPESWEE